MNTTTEPPLGTEPSSLVIEPHPRDLTPESIRQGFRVEIVCYLTPNTVTESGTVTSVEHRQAWNALRWLIHIRADDGDERKFVHFPERSGWMYIFPGMANEDNVNPRDPAYAIRLAPGHFPG